VYVIVEMLGVQPADRDLFRTWSLDIARGMETPPASPVFERMVAAHHAIGDYFRGLLAERRRHPQDDLLTRLITVQEDGGKLTECELLDICGLLFVAGHETTANLIGNGILALLLHPGQLRRLRPDSGLLPSAVAELFRYDSPVQRASRMASTNVDIGGKTIPKGGVVSAVLGAANRDPARFPDPDRLDVARRDNHHLAFGLGGRFCVGAPLARLEGQIAIGTLLSNLAQSRARCSTSSVAVLHGNPRLEGVAGGLLRGCLESAYRRKTIQHQPHPGDVQHRFPRSVLGIRSLS
jgi:cytochrome P450